MKMVETQNPLPVSSYVDSIIGHKNSLFKARSDSYSKHPVHLYSALLLWRVIRSWTLTTSGNTLLFLQLHP